MISYHSSHIVISIPTIFYALEGFQFIRLWNLIFFTVQILFAKFLLQIYVNKITVRFQQIKITN